MKDLRALLAAADPLAERPELSIEEVHAMRRAVIAASQRAPAAHGAWPGALPIAAVVVVMVAIGIAGGRRLPPPEPARAAAGAAAEAGVPTQVQFATPGGTRIIWTLDPEFELQGSTP